MNPSEYPCMFEEPPSPDVVLICGKTKFPCHKNVLERQSDYFKAMFNSNMMESKASEICIQGTNASALKILIDYAYTSKFTANDGNVNRVLEAATMFQFDPVRNACIDYLKSKLSHANCLGIMIQSDRLGIVDLHRRARQMALWNFRFVSQKSEILTLDRPLLYQYLADDGLRVESELDVYDAIKQWVQYALNERSAEFILLLPTIRFSSMTRRELHDLNCESLVKENATIKELLKRIHVIKTDRKCHVTLDDSLKHNTTLLSSLPFLNTEFCRLKDRGHEKEFVTAATELLKVPPRRTPMVPVVVGQIFGSEIRDSVPDIAYFEPNERKIVRLDGIKKVYTNSFVAIGYRVCAIGHDIYVSGGEFSLGYSNWNLSLWQYNTFTGAWNFATNLPQPRRHHNVCVLGSEIYFIGGVGRFRVVLNNVDSYNTESGEWETKASLPKPTFAAASTAHDGKIYLLTSEVACYDPKPNTWSVLRRTKLPNEMGIHSAMSHPNGIYLVGRHSLELMLFFTSIEERGEDNLPYKTIGNFQFPSENACMIGDKIYSFASQKCAIETYDVATNSFTVEYSNDDLQSPSTTIGCFELPYYS